MGTSREYEMPFPSRGKNILHQSKVIRIIKDQQPLIMRGQPVFDSSNNFQLVLFLSLRKVQECCQFYKPGDELITGGSIYPEDVVVLVTIAIGVLYGGLGFADTAQAADCLGLCRGRGFVLRQVLVELLEQFFASCKERITNIGDIPGRCRQGSLLLCRHGTGRR